MMISLLAFPRTTPRATKVHSIKRAFCIIAFLGVTTIVASCGSKLKAYPTLVNQGIMPISPTNAYLGANLFLGNESEKSSVLYQFLKGRGSPGAIEIIEEDFKPARVLLYYPRELQVYYAELDDKDVRYEWIVRGPYSIAREDFRRLLNVERARYEAAPVIRGGKVERFIAEPTPVPVVVPTSRPTPKPTPKKVLKKKPTPIVAKPAENKESPALPPKEQEIPSGIPLNSDQQALRMSRGLTELSAEGDPMHRVKGSSETLADIAKWYTGDEAKAKDIAELNSLPVEGTLPAGAKIKIPKGLAKTDQAMR